MKVPFVMGPNVLQLREIEVPAVGPRDVLLRIATVGICGSDLHLIRVGGVRGPAEQPFPLGHELSGAVAEVGAEVRSLAVGDRVIVNPRIRRIGIGAPEGGFGEWLLVRDVVGEPGSVLRLPANVSFDQGALIEPLAVAEHAVNRMQVKAGDKVAIFGAGPIGLAAIVVLRHRGLDDIVIFDFSEFRRNRGLALGAAAAFDPSKTPAAEALGRAHGRTDFLGRPVVSTTHYLEACGAPIIPELIACSRPGATICIATLQKKAVELDLEMVFTKELVVTTALGYPTELDEVIGLLEKEAIDPEAMVSHRFPADQIMAAFDMARQPDRSAKVLVQYGA